MSMTIVNNCDCYHLLCQNPCGKLPHAGVPRSACAIHPPRRGVEKVEGSGGPRPACSDSDRGRGGGIPPDPPITAVAFAFHRCHLMPPMRTFCRCMRSDEHTSELQ